MMQPGAAQFVSLTKHPLKFRLFLLAKLPSAFFAGLKVREMDMDHCVVSVPFKWFTKNPFRSTYFACLAMAAEMSTGALAMAMIYKRKPPVSMLVVGLKAEYFKKATGRTWFTCADGLAFRNAIEQSAASGESATVTAISTGSNAAGETVAIFEITWSFRVKNKNA